MRISCIILAAALLMTGCTGKAKEVKLHEEYEHDSEPKASTGVIEPEPMFFYAPNGKPQSDAAETIEIMPFFIPEDIASDGRCASCEEMEEKNGMLSAYHTGRANVNEERLPPKRAGSNHKLRYCYRRG